MIISVTSLKGGVGKSTLVQNLAVCMAHNGYKVAIADADANQSCLRWSALRNEQLPIVPAFGTPEKTLAANIKQLARDYDIVLIDGTPTLDRITSKIILLADMLIIPILPSGLDMWATEIFLERYENAKVEKEQNIPAFMVLNQYQKQISFNREVKSVLEDTPIELLENSLRPRTAYREVVVQGKGVIEYKDEKAKIEVMKLYEEIILKLDNIRI
jgi:chromosome partitioning protein